MKQHIVVIGGGIAGTAAAHILVKRGYKVTIVEKEGQLGGRIRSVLASGNTIEMGAGFITRAYSNVHAFLRSSGLDNRLSRQQAKSGIVRSGKVKIVTLSTLVSNNALSWRAKLQALPILIKVFSRWSLIDLHAPWLLDKYDTCAVADMFHGKSGKEFLEFVVEPVLDGYFYWTPERTSNAMLLIIGKALLLSGTSKLKGGLQQIPDRAATGSKLLLGRTVQYVEQNTNGTYRVIIEHQGERHTLQVNGVVCATPASVVTSIMPGLLAQQRRFFSAVSYSAGVVLAMTYVQDMRRSDLGIAFPRLEGTLLSAITVSSEPGKGKTSHRTIKVYASGVAGKKLCAKTDNQIIRTLMKEMESVQPALLIGDAEPTAMYVQRWPEALPVIDVGYFRRLRSFANGEIENPKQPLVFAGDYIGGPFMEGAFTSGVQAAERLDHRMRTDS